MFYNANATIRKSQASNINEVAEDIENTYKNDENKELNLSSDENNLRDASENNSENIKNEESVNTKQENSSNNENKQENDTLKTAKSSDNTSKQETISSSLKISSSNITVSPKAENSNSNTSKQETVTTKVESSSNKQTANSSQLKEENTNTNTESQKSTNEPLEVKKAPTIHYDRTTSIYANDNVTLLRVEYYVNNKLTYYSVIEQFEATTKSYVEKIYKCNRETNIDPLIRTDVYKNGSLIKSY